LDQVERAEAPEGGLIMATATTQKRRRSRHSIGEIERTRILKETIAYTIQAISELKLAIGDETDLRLSQQPFLELISRYFGLRSNALASVMTPYTARGEVKALVAEVRASWLKRAYADRNRLPDTALEPFKPLSWYRNRTPLYTPARVA
jgi:hypothetical protein